MKVKQLENITGLTDVMFKAIMSSNEEILIKVLNSIFPVTKLSINYLLRIKS